VLYKCWLEEKAKKLMRDASEEDEQAAQQKALAML